ncbi:MAG: FtsX-like permease family protein [Phycisphaeraceae bacterium]|nr:FtsX-like permease family protein [Phycisphaeraceae bacterium]
MAITDLTIVRRSMQVRLFSTVTTILMVGVAVALMLTLLTLKDATRNAFSRGTGNMHLLVSADSSPLVSVLNGVFYANPPARPIEWTKYGQLVRSAPWEFFIPVQQGDSYLGFPVLASTPEFFSKFEPNDKEPWSLVEGRPFERAFEVVLGSTVAKSSGLKLGDSIFLTHGIASSRQLGDPNAMQPHVHTDFKYTIVGILAPTGSAHDRALFTDLDSTWIIHAHDRRKRDDASTQTTTVEDLTDADRKITGIFARVATRPGSDVSAAIPSTAYRLRADPTITVAMPKTEIDRLFSIVSNIDKVFIAMAVVVIISSGISITLALYNSMEQRRRQIAVLRVLGSSRTRILRLILAESALLGIIGCILGLAVSLIGGQAGAATLKAQLGIFLDPTLPLRPTLLVLGGTTLLAMLAGIIPAIMAYRTPVAKNLKPIA